MKRRWMALLMALTLCLTGCGSGSAALSQTLGTAAVPPDGQADELNEGQVLRQSIFALRSGYDILSGREDVCYSPVSAYFALALAASGAEGQTQKELLDVLEVSDAATLAGDMKALYERLYETDELYSVLPANSLWVRRGIDVYESFTENAAQNFYAHTFALDFEDPKAGTVISDWISEQTKGLLTPEIELDSDTGAAVLLNTLYFKANWSDAFLEENTAPAPFTRADGSSVECDFLRGRRDGSYMEYGGTKIATVPMYGGYEMVFLLPDEELGVAGLLEQYSADRLLSVKPEPPEDSAVIYSWNSADTLLSEQSEAYRAFGDLPARVCEVDWRIPKFHTTTELSLIDTLKGLGVHDAFSDTDADFGGICDVSKLPGETLYISKVQQGTDFSLDEEGVEAATYTMLDMAAGAAMPPEEPVEMHLDRPFLYGVRNADGVFLFVGRCDNPSAA